jgi:hypothetical protein
MVEVAEHGPDALAFLRAVYLNSTLPLPTRMRAAEAALPFERPKLAAVISTNLSGEDFGLALERARKRMLEGPQLEGPQPRTADSPSFEPKALPRPGRPGAKAYRTKGLLEP